MSFIIIGCTTIGAGTGAGTGTGKGAALQHTSLTGCASASAFERKPICPYTSVSPQLLPSGLPGTMPPLEELGPYHENARFKWVAAAAITQHKTYGFTTGGPSQIKQSGPS
jgi:hypothetical protein